jgi:hypothetical protein
MGESRIVEPNPSNGGLSLRSRSMKLELNPEQPAAVTEAVAELIDPPTPAADPWWQAGIDEILET